MSWEFVKAKIYNNDVWNCSISASSKCDRDRTHVFQVSPQLSTAITEPRRRLVKYAVRRVRRDDKAIFGKDILTDRNVEQSVWGSLRMFVYLLHCVFSLIALIYISTLALVVVVVVYSSSRTFLQRGRPSRPARVRVGISPRPSVRRNESSQNGRLWCKREREWGREDGVNYTVSSFRPCLHMPPCSPLHWLGTAWWFVVAGQVHIWVSCFLL